MRVSRLYVSFSLAVGQQVALDEDNAHYVRTVLRLRQSAEVILFNGLGGEYLGKIDEVSRKSVLITAPDAAVLLNVEGIRRPGGC